MHEIGVRAAAAAFALLIAATGYGQGANPRVLYERAKQAIARGNVVPERDLAPLVAVLKMPASDDDLRTAIDSIETLADSSGSSPAAVRHYLLDQATPLLLKIGAEGPTAFARGDALTALRDIGASRAVLEQAAGTAERDREPGANAHCIGDRCAQQGDHQARRGDMSCKSRSGVCTGGGRARRDLTVKDRPCYGLLTCFEESQRCPSSS